MKKHGDLRSALKSLDNEIEKTLKPLPKHGSLASFMSDDEIEAFRQVRLGRARLWKAWELLTGEDLQAQ